jgi:hexosaminidase
LITPSGLGRGFFTLVLYCLILPAFEANAQLPAIIPYPNQLIKKTGQFRITPLSTVSAGDETFFHNEQALLCEIFEPVFGKPLMSTPGTNAAILLQYDPFIQAVEGYRININAASVTLSASTAAGMFHAVQTFRQLLPESIEVKSAQVINFLEVPALEIIDAPQFAWRGLHLDVSRHFFSISYIKKLLDLMALYRYNKFHLHLTDDQGWRMEIKKYPELTAAGAWRTFNNQDSATMVMAKENPDFIIDPKHIRQVNGTSLYGGFYTQAELKDLVTYAANRHIDIIPEIDMPGHMMAAIRNFKYLSCDSTSLQGTVFTQPLCPCLPSTLNFARDIYTEVMEVFPSTYLHIGGDEVDRSFWERSPACQTLMKENNIKTTAGLQSWFIGQMNNFFQSKGRKLIGWDEIMEGGAAPGSTIMYWRTWAPDAPKLAASTGHKVIMAPNSPLYFSQPPDKNSLKAIYEYQPVSPKLTRQEAKYIIGAQGNLWTENVVTEARADYLYLPSITALSEVLWTRNKNFGSYQRRLQKHYSRLDLLQVRYRLPDLGLMDNYAFTDQFSLRVPLPLSSMSLRYTLDGSRPSQLSALLNGSLVITSDARMRLAAFMPDGRQSDVYEIGFSKQPLSVPLKKTGLKNGLKASWYTRAFDSTVLISGNPDSVMSFASVTLPEKMPAPSFTLQFNGYIQVPQDGIYSFFLTSDDAAFLRIAGRDVVNNDGMHAPREKNGQVALRKGLHAFALDFIEGGGGYTLKLNYSLNGSDPKPIPVEWWKN